MGGRIGVGVTVELLHVGRWSDLHLDVAAAADDDDASFSCLTAFLPSIPHPLPFSPALICFGVSRNLPPLINIPRSRMRIFLTTRENGEGETVVAVRRN